VLRHVPRQVLVGALVEREQRDGNERDPGGEEDGAAPAGEVGPASAPQPDDRLREQERREDAESEQRHARILPTASS